MSTYPKRITTPPYRLMYQGPDLGSFNPLVVLYHVKDGGVSEAYLMEIQIPYSAKIIRGRYHNGMFSEKKKTDLKKPQPANIEDVMREILENSAMSRGLRKAVEISPYLFKKVKERCYGQSKVH